MGERGKWVMGMEEAPVGMSTGCCIAANVTINYILKKENHLETLILNSSGKWTSLDDTPEGKQQLQSAV